MPYKMTYGQDDWLYDPYDDERRLWDVSLSQSSNSISYLEFSMAVSHPLAGDVAVLDEPVYLYLDGELLFKGKIESIERDVQGSYSVTCADALAYLNDSLIRPYSTVEGEEDIFADVSNYKEYLEWIVGQHNSNVRDTDKKFDIDVNEGADLESEDDVTDESDFYKSSSSCITPSSVIENDVTGVVGGYLELEYDEGSGEDDARNVISFYSDNHESNSQIIDFGSNVTDITITTDTEDFYSAIRPMGGSPEYDEDDVETEYAYRSCKRVDLDLCDEDEIPDGSKYDWVDKVDEDETDADRVQITRTTTEWSNGVRQVSYEMARCSTDIDSILALYWVYIYNKKVTSGQVRWPAKMNAYLKNHPKQTKFPDVTYSSSTKISDIYTLDEIYSYYVQDSDKSSIEETATSYYYAVHEDGEWDGYDSSSYKWNGPYNETKWNNIEFDGTIVGPREFLLTKTVRTYEVTLKFNLYSGEDDDATSSDIGNYDYVILGTKLDGDSSGADSSKYYVNTMFELHEYDYTSEYQNDFDILLTDCQDYELADEDLVIDDDVLYSESRVSKYGYREFEWQDEDLKNNAKFIRRAAKELKKVYDPETTVEARAVDLALIDEDYSHLKVGQAVRVRSKPHGVDEYLSVQSIDLDLMEPGNSEYTLGKEKSTLTGEYSSYLASETSSINIYVDAVSSSISDSTINSIINNAT